MKAVAQKPVQNIRGNITDIASGVPIPSVSVLIKNSQHGTTTDSVGNFIINKVPVGRYDILISAVGYESVVLNEVTVSSAQETVLSPSLKESVSALDEVVVKAGVNKYRPLNNMAIASARMLSVEEAGRYAGGFDDPARLVASFAGVASNVGNNGIVIRGNNPNSLQWKMEGVEIPNPNHFADLTSFGGGGITALSSRLLANSDFFSGAFPAEYNNALSGVFDIFMRTGSNTEQVNAFQLGIIGIDASSEGPFKEGGASSYLFNYRYSTLALMGPIIGNDAGVSYQDLSFKLNFPTKNAGTFSLWGIGLIDRSGQDAKKNPEEWEYKSDKETMGVRQYMGAMGLTHRIPISEKSYLKTTLASTISGINLKTDSLNMKMDLVPEERIRNSNTHIILSAIINTKFNRYHTNKSGLTITGAAYDMSMKNQERSGYPLQVISDEDGFSTLASAFTASSFTLSDKLTMNAGINAQLFTLNSHYTIEPRLAFRYRAKNAQSFHLAYGLHSRLERINYYFIKNSAYGNDAINKNLNFAKSHHFVLGYDKLIGENIYLKAETYYQYLFDTPVIKDSSFSFVNLQNDWFFNNKLQNTGKGRNFGVDFTLEKYMSKGFYWMITTSLFKSEYKGGDNIWRDTRYSRNYVINILSGKEWQLGRSKENIFGLNVRFSYQGGDRYSPLDITASLKEKKAVYDEYNAFSLQYDPAFITHFTASYKINRRRTTHEFALKVINATSYKEHLGFEYNYLHNTIDDYREATFIPNISYKIEF